MIQRTTKSRFMTPTGSIVFRVRWGDVIRH